MSMWCAKLVNLLNKMTQTTKQFRHAARARRTNTVARTSGRVRLVVNRSNKTVYAQLVDDSTGKVVCGTSGLKTKATGIAAATEVGTAIAEMAKKNKIAQVAFDRNGYKYHGQIKALADAAREAGLEF